MKGSFADKVRKVMEQLGGGDTLVTTDAIYDALGVALPESKRRVRTAIKDLKKSGEIESVDRGVYRWLGKTAPAPEIREAMWKLLRARRVVTVDDLRELAGASKRYAREWLLTLAKHGVVRKTGARYQLIKDTIVMPDLADNAEKLREIRRRKKAEALRSLEQAAAAIASAKTALTSMEV